MKIKLIRLFVVFTSLSIYTETAYAQTPAGNYPQAFLSLKQAVDKEYRDSTTGLYRDEPALNKTTQNKYSYLWPLCGLLQAANEQEKMQPGSGAVAPVWAAIQQYYDPASPAPAYASYIPALGGGSRFYDDNQWIAISLLNAYARVHNRAYLDSAAMIYRFMMTGFDTTRGGGLYWEEHSTHSKNTCSNGPGVLVALDLYKITKHQYYLDTALLLYNWVNAHLRSPEGLYYDNIRMKDGSIGKAQYSYNTGTMLEADVYLFEITHDKTYLQQAKKTAESALSYFYAGGKFRDSYWFNAVLLRAFQHLLQHDKDNKYVKAFEKCTLQALNSDKNADGLMGVSHHHSLVDQAGMLEILARLAWMQQRKLI